MLIVHCKTFVPIAIAVKPDVSKVGVVMVAKPDISVQLPVPIAGVLAIRFVND